MLKKKTFSFNKSGLFKILFTNFYFLKFGYQLKLFVEVPKHTGIKSQFSLQPYKLYGESKKLKSIKKSIN